MITNIPFEVLREEGELPYRIDRRAGYQGSRPSVRGLAEVEKSVTGHHYSEVTSSGWHRTHYHFKYNKSNRFLVYLMLLLTTI